MTTDKKPKTVPLVRFGATLPEDLHRKLKSVLAARGESLQSWLVARATQEINAGWPGLPDTAGGDTASRGSATSQNAASAPRPAPKALPGE